MGWTFNPDLNSRKRMIDYVTSKDGVWRGDPPYEPLDHSVVGNQVYVLARHPEGYRFIALFLLSSGGEEGWGYKDMDESCGPGYYNCPERLLAQSDVEDKHGWREKCRQVRREKNGRRKALVALRERIKPGDKLTLKDGREIVYRGPCSVMRNNFYCSFPGSKQEYVARWALVRIAP